jgi:putative endonuclease
MNRTEMGRHGEKLALEYLNNEGYKILDINYRVSRIGEIDIIVSKEGCICFIEVKTRTGYAFGTPAEAVSWKKQNTIRKIAACYLKAHGLMDSRVQFDVIEVIVTKKGELIKLSHIREAF